MEEKINSLDFNTDIPLDVLNEIVQDSFFFTLFLRIKRNMNSVSAKSYMAMFMKQTGSIFLWELVLALEKYYGIDKTKIYEEEKYNKQIKTERNNIKKKIKNSETLKKRIDFMGIEFDEIIYDINISLNKQKHLLQFNLEDYGVDEDIGFWNGIFLFPEQIIELSKIRDLNNIFKEIEEKIKFGTDLLEKS